VLSSGCELENISAPLPFVLIKSRLTEALPAV
jgi:hypothetical protein